MNTIPTPTKRVIIIGGRLKMSDGSSLHKYLKVAQGKLNLKDGDFINIASHDRMRSIIEDANITITRVC
jgi:hypothetical protein